MQTKLLWQFDPSHGLSMSIIYESTAEFYKRYSLKPTCIRLSVNDYAQYLRNNSYASCLLTLEEGKKYAHYLTTPCGPVRLDLMEESEDKTTVGQSVAPGGQPIYSVMVVENTDIDKEFEKIILDKDQS